MRKDIPIRSDVTKNRNSKTGKILVLMQLIKRKLRYMKRILNDRQRILDEMLGTIQYSIKCNREKENSAYVEQITETNSGIMQEINSTYIQRISSLLQRKLRKTWKENICAQSIRSFGQKSLFDRKELKSGTDLRIWISSMMVPPKNGRYSEVFT